MQFIKKKGPYSLVDADIKSKKNKRTVLLLLINLICTNKRIFSGFPFYRTSIIITKNSGGGPSVVLANMLK